MKIYMLTTRDIHHTEFHADRPTLIERAYEILHQYGTPSYITTIEVPDTPQGLADYLNFLVHGDIPLTHMGKIAREH